MLPPIHEEKAYIGIENCDPSDRGHPDKIIKEDIIMSKLMKKSIAVFAAAAILASTSVTAFAATTEPEVPAENTDKVVWINGKDVKGSKDGSTPAHLFKTESFAHRGMFTGGKWAVAVTSADVKDADAFAALFGEGTKMDATAAKAAKELASAKIKDGVVTVTAGKKSGDIKVWVYEINNKKLVNEDDRNGIKPTEYTFTVKNASSALNFTTKVDDIKDGVLAKGEKAQKLGFKDGEKNQDAVTYYFGDKALANDGTLEIDEEGKNAYDKAVVEAELSKDNKSGIWSLELTPLKAGKTNVVVKVKESGKAVKIAVEVVASYKITLAKGVDVTATANKAALEFDKAGEAWVTSGTAVSFSKDVVVGGTTYKAGKAVKVTGNITVEDVPAAPAA